MTFAAARETARNDAPAVLFDHVSFSYRNTPVLSEADFSLPRGGLCVLEGGNGTGKSTFARLLLGELAPDEGSIELFGQDVAHFARWPEVGYVPQQIPADYDRFPATVLEVVRAGLYSAAGPLLPYRHLHRVRALEVLAAVDLRGLEHRLIGELSGGQFQRVLLARALVAAPRLLVLDEPTSNLDDPSTESFYRIVVEAQRAIDAAVLLITHDLARMPPLGGSIWTLERGVLSRDEEDGRAGVEEDGRIGSIPRADAAARSRGHVSSSHSKTCRPTYTRAV